MYKILALFLIAVSSVSAFWSECYNHPDALAPTNITSPACSGSLCTVVRGEVLTSDIYLEFTSAHSSLDVRASVYIHGVLVDIPIDPPHNNACNFMYRGGIFVGCPTVAGQEHVWKIEMEIPLEYPEFYNEYVRYELFESGSRVACADLLTVLY